jgi:hypothetical protein
VGEHFGVSLREVTIIGEWDLSPDEVPVVLFLARRAGVSSDALIGLKRQGMTWMGICGRFGLGAATFHIPLPEGADLGPLTRAHAEFRSRPANRWGEIQLNDAEIVAFVNVQVLSEQVRIPPTRVLDGFRQAGSFVAAYPFLPGR